MFPIYLVMAESENEKETPVPDPVAGMQAQSASVGEPVEEEKRLADDNLVRDEDDSISSAPPPAAASNAALDKTKSYATDASATTAATSRHADNEPRPWYRKLNPMRWTKARPVPKERTICPEYRAGFFSQLIFQWINPLMTVIL